MKAEKRDKLHPPNSYTEKTLPPPLLDTVKMADELNSHPNHILPYSGT